MPSLTVKAGLKSRKTCVDNRRITSYSRLELKNSGIKTKKVLSCILVCCFFIVISAFAENTGFTQEDRERLVR
ncbi:hypothetical protein JCM12298_07290 [Desulfothermus naphthae]